MNLDGQVITKYKVIDKFQNKIKIIHHKLPEIPKNIHKYIYSSYFCSKRFANLASYESAELYGDHLVRLDPGNTISPGFNLSLNGERTPNKCLISYLGRVLPIAR